MKWEPRDHRRSTTQLNEVVKRTPKPATLMFGCYMSRPFAHPVACCCPLLRVVTQSLKPVKLLNSQHCWPTSVGSCCVH